MANDQSTRGLTIKPVTPEILEEDGKTVAAHLTEVITDPNEARAVQVPNSDEYPTANATGLDPLSIHSQENPADALDTDEANVNEVQRIDPTGTVSGGTYDVVLAPGTEFETTLTAVPFDATPTAVNALLDAEESIHDAENNKVVLASGAAVSAGNLDFTFQNALAGQDVPELTVEDAAITGGGTLAAVTVTPGQHADD